MKVSKNLFAGLLLATVTLPCLGYRRIHSIDELKRSLDKSPNAFVLFYDTFSYRKKPTVTRLESKFNDMNIDFFVAETSSRDNAVLRRYVQGLGIEDFPAFAIFKKGELVKTVFGDPSDGDLKQEINQQLILDPQNWTLYNNAAYHLCHWQHRNETMQKVLPQKCHEQAVPSMLEQNFMSNEPIQYGPPPQDESGFIDTSKQGQMQQGYPGQSWFPQGAGRAGTPTRGQGGMSIPGVGSIPIPGVGCPGCGG